MEHLITEIEAYCRAAAIEPQRLLRAAINAKWSQWQSWKDGGASPTMATADRLRAYMAANPPQRGEAA